MPNHSSNILPPLILASASPRRSELLKRIGIPFETLSAELVEDDLINGLKQENPKAITFDFAKSAALSLARGKSKTILKERPDCLVIGADTLVSTEREILGKPSGPEEAAGMLRSLCGRTHRVYTAVCLLGNGIDWEFCSETSVTFHSLDIFQEALIRRYILSGSPCDKAGGYGIQDLGSLLISGINGDYYTVVGLPLSELARKLFSLGYHPVDEQGGLLCPD